MPLSQVSQQSIDAWLANEWWKSEYRVRAAIGKKLDAMFLENPRTPGAVLVMKLQDVMDSLEPPTVKMLAARLEFNNSRGSFGGMPARLSSSSPLSSVEEVAPNEAAPRAKGSIRSFDPNGPVPRGLINLPASSRGGERGITVQETWEIYNKISQRCLGPNDLHLKLLKHFGDTKPKPRFGTWADKWFIQYQYYKEVGDEIERRSEDGGKSVQEIMARLEAIRLSIRDRRTMKALADGIRIWRGGEAFVTSKSKMVEEVDISEALDAAY
jgi:hypothetical protein